MLTSPIPEPRAVDPVSHCSDGEIPTAGQPTVAGSGALPALLEGLRSRAPMQARAAGASLQAKTSVTTQGEDVAQRRSSALQRACEIIAACDNENDPDSYLLTIYVTYIESALNGRVPPLWLEEMTIDRSVSDLQKLTLEWGTVREMQQRYSQLSDHERKRCTSPREDRWQAAIDRASIMAYVIDCINAFMPLLNRPGFGGGSNS